MAESKDEVTLIELLIILAKHKRFIIGCAAVFAVLGAAASFLVTPMYAATASILPPQQNQSTATAMLGQLGAITGVGPFSIKGSGDLYIGLLKSRNIVDSLVSRFELQRLYKTKYASDAGEVLKGASNIRLGPEGIITIEVVTPEPQLSAALANGYVEELTRLTNTLAVTEAGQRRLFFEREVAAAKAKLLEAEMAARQSLDKAGIATVDEQGRSMLEASAALRAQITAKELQLGAMRTFAGDENPELFRAKQEMSLLKQQLAKIESAPSAAPSSAGSSTSYKGLQSLSLLREVKYFQVLVDLLVKQYEGAKIDEAREGAVIQMVDKAVQPDRRSRPNRILITLLSGVIGGFLAVLMAFVIEMVKSLRSDSEGSEQIHRLRRYLAWR